MIRYLAGVAALIASLAAAAAPQLVVPYTGPVVKSEKAKPFKSTGSRITFNALALANLVPGQEVELTLPDGTKHAIVFDYREDKAGGITSWIGHYKGATPVLRTIITTGPGGSFGRIATPDNEYSIMPGSGFDWLVDMKAEKPFLPPIRLEHDEHRPPRTNAKSGLVPQAYEPGTTQLVPGVNSPAIAQSTAAVSAPTPGAIVDILMVYTSGLAADLGPALQTRFQQLIASANTMFADSGVAVTMRVVGSVQVNYTDDESVSDSVGALYDITPGSGSVNAAFGNVETLRTQYGADMVTLLRDGYSNGGDGVAWVGGATLNPAYMYSVMTGCTMSCDWVWVHELGHNFGNAHDRATNAWENGGTNVAGAFPYSFGYYHCDGGQLALSCAAFSGGCTGGEPECSSPGGNDFSDIMAYFQGSTLKNMVFSNPALDCQGSTGPGVACGSAAGNADQANAALTINNNRLQMAALYPSKVGNPTTTMLVTSLPTSTVGQGVTFTATVASGSGTPAGSVAFSADGTTPAGCGSVSLDGTGQAACSTSALAAGTHAIVAQYGGTTSFLASASAALTQTVNAKPSTTTALATSVNPSSGGQSVTFTATIGSGTAGTFTGSMAFLADGAAIAGCGAVSVNGSTVTCTTSTLGAGDHSIVAQYSGNASYSGSNSSTLVQSVRLASSVALATSVTPANTRQPVVFTATVSGGGAAPGGTVVFKDGASVINGCAAASVFNNVAKCTTSALVAGSHSITAAFAGDITYFASSSSALSQSISATVQPPPAGGAKRLDFNGDGKSDIVWQGADGSVSLWLMDGTSIAARGGVFGPSAGAVTRAGDFNGDGKVDFVRQLADGSTTITYMNGLDVIAGGPTLRGPSSSKLINVGDFNGDGITDLLWRNADKSVEMWLMSATQAPTIATIMPAGTGWTVSKVGDFNGDGNDDIIWGNTDGSNSLWLMNGTAQLTRGPLLPAGSPWRAAWVGDFNHDGRDDIAWVNVLDGSVSMWLMNGLATLQRGPLLGGNSGQALALVGDFNGDGNADLVWRGADGSVSLWLMNGLGVMSQSTLFGAGAPWTPSQATDANGDGKADFLWTKTDGTVGLWLMNGAATLDHRTVMNATTAWSIATTVEQNR
ncbi:MAG TPA: Ig-like domain repeat protein [Usitatibacter sp.]|jgi:hypothetical protein|nr:Ig-like domain repeat protein [Usitatibacter sp.]